MPGVVVLLDEERATRVQEFANELSRYGGTPATTGFPHVTLHAAGAYDVERVQQAVKSLARSLPRFELSTAGAGIFPGDPAYVYLTVVRKPRLTVLQRAVFEEVCRFGSDTDPVWDPDRWVPHITLATFPKGAERLGEAVAWLIDQDITFEFPVTGLSIGQGDPDPSVLYTAPLEA